MFKITENKSIYVTRGDIANIVVSAMEGEELHIFKPTDVIRFVAYEKGACNQIVLAKSVTVEEKTDKVLVQLTTEDTTIGELVNKPVDYWYEVELNPETAPQTIIGYDEKGPKIFRIYPEGVILGA